ncbi:MAG: SAP domain-containing protein [Gammaproteobacteria bacterium]|nr:SAP domain-containing protein [Gammaproteobacteria bacterium]
MNVQEVREVAIAHGIKPGKLNKQSLIKTIQKSEGNFDCFATAVNSECDQSGCLWRQDCFAAARNPVPSG